MIISLPDTCHWKSPFVRWLVKRDVFMASEMLATWVAIAMFGFIVKGRVALILET